ncbi:MAG: hypothetical protein ABIA75_06645 [Candidatus Neomarinimicrobiota bacterium]
MDHVVYVDAKAKEMDNLLDGTRTMIIRGAAGRKLPHGRVFKDDILYFINNNAEGLVKARGTVAGVINSGKMTKNESTALVDRYADKLQLSDREYQRWAGKHYLVLIEVGNVQAVAPFEIDKSEYGNMDDWLPVENINRVQVSGGRDQ